MIRHAFALFLFGLCSCSLANTISPPVTLRELSGAWLGGTEANSEYLRLEIDQQGKGNFDVQYLPGRPAAAYLVLAMHLAQYTVHFELQPLSGAEPIFLRGYAHMGGMEREIGNVEHRWHRKVVLEPERSVLSRIEAVTKRAHEVNAPQQ